MTDGGIYYSGHGEEFKKFNTKDGYGIVKLQRSGVKVGIITGRVSAIVRVRAKELGISDLYQNLDNKMEAYRKIKKKLEFADAEVAYVGDDEPDIPVLKCVGFAAAPADAMPEVCSMVHYVCSRKGGDGAVREVIDLILDAQS